MHLGMAICSVSFLGHCDLVDPDLISRIIVSGAYLLHYLRYMKESQIWCVGASWDGGVPHTIFGPM